MYTAYFDSYNNKLKTHKFLNNESPNTDGYMPLHDEYYADGPTVQQADLNLIKFMETLRDRIEQDIEKAKKLYNQYWPETPLEG